MRHQPQAPLLQLWRSYRAPKSPRKPCVPRSGAAPRQNAFQSAVPSPLALHLFYCVLNNSQQYAPLSICTSIYTLREVGKSIKVFFLGKLWRVVEGCVEYQILVKHFPHIGLFYGKVYKYSSSGSFELFECTMSDDDSGLLIDSSLKCCTNGCVFFSPRYADLRWQSAAKFNYRNPFEFFKELLSCNYGKEIGLVTIWVVFTFHKVDALKGDNRQDRPRRLVGVTSFPVCLFVLRHYTTPFLWLQLIFKQYSKIGIRMSYTACIPSEFLYHHM